MSPLDESLRRTLTSRTDHLDLPPDFVDGVERRARGIRRRRVTAAVAGSALAVTALGVGGPVVASLVTSAPVERPPTATAPPTPPTPEEAPYALDPADPWDYRGDPDVLTSGTPETVAREWAVRHATDEADVRLSPLYGETSMGETVLAFLAEGGGLGPRWGVARSSESGPELLVDVPLLEGTRALPWGSSTAAGARLLVVAAPETTLEYSADVATAWRAMEAVASGVGATELDGDPATDAVRVLGPDGAVLVTLDAPSVEDEGHGTQTPLEVDPAGYAWSTADPWSYRGPTELAQHPDLASDDERLFAAGGRGRGDGSWSQRPLLATEQPDGLSVLMVLHTRGDDAIVTTTWQRQDEAAQQVEEPVSDGQLVVQAPLLQSDGTVVVVALAAPRTGAMQTDVRGVEQLANEQGFALWSASIDAGPGDLLLYSEGDGRPLHSEPLDTDPAMPRG